MAFWVQNFLRLRRAVKGFAFGTVLDRPESATLAVTIIPVSTGSGVATPGTSFVFLFGLGATGFLRLGGSL